MAPLPPARLLTLIGTGDHLFASMIPTIVRMRLSVPPPGANGTTTSMGLIGYLACARARAGSPATARNAAHSVANALRVSIGSILLDGSLVLQRALLGLAVAELGEHGGVVLSQQRGRTIDGAGRVGQLDRYAERLDRARARVLEMDDHVARPRVGVGEGFGIVVDRPRRDAGCVQPGQPVRAGGAGGRLLDLGDERVAVTHAVTDAGEASIGGEVGPLDGPAERLEQLVVVGADGEPAVAGAQGLVGCGQTMGRAERPGRAAGHPVLGRLPYRERQRRLQQRSVDELPLAGALAVLERAQDAVGAEEAGREIAHRHARLGWRSVLVARHADDPAHALRDQVVAAARG